MRPAVLNLRAGEWIEVRSREEILSTLDETGRFESLLFMPEMLRYCGARLRVFKRADKTCDYVGGWSMRRMTDAVFLEGVRCDGAGHDGCEAGCLIFWKEAWLKRLEASAGSSGAGYVDHAVTQAPHDLVEIEDLLKTSQVVDGETVFSCQAREVRKFTSPLRSWDPRQYARDLRSGNLTSGLASDSRAERVLDMTLGLIAALRALTITVFNRVQSSRHRPAYPVVSGTAGKTPLHKLDLQPGELVRVRNKDEILATLDQNQRNRGLYFDSEMLPYCGGIYRVLRRVHRLIDEATGRMLDMKFPCIVLEGVVCKGDFHSLCPRAIYAFWRESWLERVSADVLPMPAASKPSSEACQPQLQVLR